MGILDIVPAGVVTGQNLLKVFEYGKMIFVPQYYFFLAPWFYSQCIFLYDSSWTQLCYPCHQLYFY